MRADKFEKLLSIFVKSGLTILIIIIFSQQIEFTSLDLGRHLANGREIWHDTGLLFRNFYSYTEPNQAFVNHHWLIGIVYYAIYRLGGFNFLSIFNIAVWLAAFFLAWRLARQRAGFYWTAWLSWPAIFLFSQRTDIRPENISYLFLLIVWFLLEKSQADGLKKRLLWLFPLFLIWVNTHIYFFLGLAFLFFWSASVFLPPAWKRLFNQADFKDVWRAGWENLRPWAKYFGFAVLACLMNPNLIKGLLYPFNILREYGYEIAENKSVFFLENLMSSPVFFLFKAGLVLLVVSFFVFWLVRRRLNIFEVLLAALFIGLALFASRNLAMFSLVALILASRNFSELSYLEQYISRPEIVFRIRLASLAALSILIFFSIFYLWSDSQGQHKIIRHNLGWGLAAGSFDSFVFFRDSNLSGPLFNNYDLGSALAFWLYPQEKVFVDNRPEAYSVKFFKEIYKPMQENSYDWNKYRDIYGIRTVYFSHTDMTPWGRSFLRSILSNQRWALVYVDRYIVILVDKQNTDEKLVAQHIITEPALRVRLRELSASSDDSGRLYLASLAEIAGQADIALEIYRQILLNNVDDVRALASIGSIYAASGDMVQAINYLSRAIDNGRRLPGIYNERGLAYFNLGRYEKAAADWQAALKLEKHNTAAGSYLKQLGELQAQGSVPRF